MIPDQDRLSVQWTLSLRNAEPVRGPFLVEERGSAAMNTVYACRSG